MNQEEELYFKVLSKQGREAWTIFKNPMYRGALEIAQNLYKDKAHFVYELLQENGKQLTGELLRKANLLLFIKNYTIVPVLFLKSALKDDAGNAMLPEDVIELMK